MHDHDEGNVLLYVCTHALNAYAIRFEDARFLIHSLGMLEMQLHSYPAAFEAFARGLCLYPDDSHLLLGAALTEMRLNEVLRAIKGS